MPRRPAIPRPLQRDVLIEAGHRCAIPTCRQPTVDIAHIEPWAKVKEHRFENLIALCPNCHRRVHNREIDQPSLRQYKANLGLIHNRYGDYERRVLDFFVATGQTSVQLPSHPGLLLMYLIRDGLLRDISEEIFEQRGGIKMGGVMAQPVFALTEAGAEFVTRLREARELD